MPTADVTRHDQQDRQWLLLLFSYNLFSYHMDCQEKGMFQAILREICAPGFTAFTQEV